MKWW